MIPIIVIIVSLGLLIWAFNHDGYQLMKLTAGVLATIGLYSVLYKENRLYRFFEHMFLGLAAGWAITALWTESLFDTWWMKMMGKPSDVPGDPGEPGYWAYMLLLPIGLMGYLVFSKKHNWMSRIPIGIILGLWSGQQIQVWFNRYGPQISSSMKPIIPTATDSFFAPGTAGLSAADAATINARLYPTEAISNVIYVFTILAVLSYFIYSIDLKSGFARFVTTSGRWLLMVGFGAIFGTTVLMRFSLLIDRMYFVWIEWLQNGVLRGG